MKPIIYFILSGVAGIAAYLILTNMPLSFPAHDDAIKLAYIESPPYYFTNKEGKPEGIVIDITDKVMQRAGYKWSASSFSVHRIVNLLSSGQADLWVGLSTLSQFKDITLIGNSEIGKVTLNAYYIGDKPPVTKKEDLCGKSVIIMKEYSYGGWVNFIKDPVNKIRYIELYIRDPAFDILKSRRADYLLDYEIPAKRKLEKINIPNLNHNIISTFALKFVVSKKTPNAQEVLNQLEKAYDDLLKECKVEKF